MVQLRVKALAKCQKKTGGLESNPTSRSSLQFDLRIFVLSVQLSVYIVISDSKILCTEMLLHHQHYKTNLCLMVISTIATLCTICAITISYRENQICLYFLSLFKDSFKLLLLENYKIPTKCG